MSVSISLYKTTETTPKETIINLKDNDLGVELCDLYSFESGEDFPVDLETLQGFLTETQLNNDLLDVINQEVTTTSKDTTYTMGVWW